MSNTDTNTTPIIILNYVIFLNYYPCRYVDVVIHKETAILNYNHSPNIKIHMIATATTILNHASKQWTNK